jgi:hypothetical protein
VAVVSIRMTDQDLAKLDEVRGQADRSACLRGLVHRAYRGKGEGKAKLDPTTAEGAVALLAQAAEYDSAAAMKLVEATTGRERLERLRAITHPPVSRERSNLS